MGYLDSMYNPIFRTNFGGQLPTQRVQGAPSYDLNTAAGQGLLGMTMGAGNAGADLNGVNAFSPNYNLYSAQDQFGRYQYNVDPLKNLAQQIGYDTSGYNLDPYANGGKDSGQLFADLNNKLKDYHYISGLSQGWNPQGGARGADRTLYLNNGNNVLNPVTSPVDYTAREKGNWFQENPEFVSALSVMLPAFGGWAGLAGQAAGAAGASMGLGTTGLGALGTAAANAAGGAAMGAATGGTKGALTSLAGSAGGYLGNMAGSALGNYGSQGAQLGSNVGKTLAGMYLPNSPGISPGSTGGGFSSPFQSGQWQQTGKNQYTDLSTLNNRY